MDFLTVVLGFLIALTFIHTLQTYRSRRKNLPPGPARFPVIGSLHLLGDQPHKSLASLAKIHGPLMLIRLGFVNTVVISSPAVAREMLKQDLMFSNRMVPDAGKALDQYKYSVIWLPVASRWRSLRKILNSNIFSGSRLAENENLRVTKVKELIAYCHESSLKGEAVDIGQATFRTVLNLLSNTFFSKDLTDQWSDSTKEFKELFRKIVVEAAKPNPVDFFPFLRRFDPLGIRRRMEQYIRAVLNIFSGLIEDRLKQKLESGAEYNDVIGQLLMISNKTPGELDRMHIERMCFDLFIAGTDTTSSTIEWAMAEALRNPETMKKAKAELEEVIGKGKNVKEEDITSLPYLQCMVKETLRIHPPAPFLIPRCVENDVQICSYNIPKKSQVLVNVWAMGRDPEVWPSPLEFKPERFLGSDIDVRGHDMELIPFGVGRRICPGLPLAIRMMPVVLGSLLNTFDWKLDGGIEPQELNMEEKFGITLQKAQPLCAIPIPH